MQLIKPERKVIYRSIRYDDSDVTVHFHYSKNLKSNTLKRFFRVSIINFFRKNNLKWRRVTFAIDNGKVIFSEGYNKDSFHLTQTGYICNINLVATICEVYKIQIPDQNKAVLFQCKEIRKNVWQLIPKI